MTDQAIIAPSNPSAGAPDLDKLYARITWRIIPFFCLCFLAAYVDRTNVGLAKLQMSSELGFSNEIYGLGAGLFFVGYILCEVPSNLILHKVGARIWIARIMISWGAVSAAMMFVATPTQFYILRLLLGVAEAGFLPGVIYYLNNWYPAERRSRILALFLIGIPLSNVIGAPISGWVLGALDKAMGLAGWQWLFLVEGIPSILLGLATLVILSDRIGTATWLSSAEKKLLEDRLDSEHAGHDLQAFGAAFRDWRVWMIGGVDGTILLGLYLVTFWLPTIIRDTGLHDAAQIGLVTAIPHLVGLAAMIANGYHSDRRKERRWHVALALLTGAAGLLLATFAAKDLVFTIIALSIANAGVLGALPPFWCLPGMFLRGRAAAGGIALALSVANCAGFFSTYLVGWLLDWTHTANAAFILFAACLIASSMVVARLPASLFKS